MNVNTTVESRRRRRCKLAIIGLLSLK